MLQLRTMTLLAHLTCLDSRHSQPIEQRNWLSTRALASKILNDSLKRLSAAYTTEPFQANSHFRAQRATSTSTSSIIYLVTLHLTVSTSSYLPTQTDTDIDKALSHRPASTATVSYNL